jgi:hypothetical protein
LKKNLYRQVADVELINILKPHLSNLQFFDLGAEKGGLDYFYSLNKVPAHGFFKQSNGISVDCRSLASLFKGGEIPNNV